MCVQRMSNGGWSRVGVARACPTAAISNGVSPTGLDWVGTRGLELRGPWLSNGCTDLQRLSVSPTDLAHHAFAGTRDSTTIRLLVTVTATTFATIIGRSGRVSPYVNSQGLPGQQHEQRRKRHLRHQPGPPPSD